MCVIWCWYVFPESHRFCDRVQDAYTMRCCPQVTSSQVYLYIPKSQVSPSGLYNLYTRYHSFQKLCGEFSCDGSHMSDSPEAEIGVPGLCGVGVFFLLF